MIIMRFTDTHGDPVLVNWEHVTVVEEIANTTGGKRVFLRTRICDVSGKSIEVTDTVPQIELKLEQVQA